MTLTTALAKSLNTVAARLAAEVGPANVASTARRLGIVSPLHENPSIALGTAEVTPLEITSAYVPFANGGYGVLPFVIDTIRTKSGKVLFHRQGDGVGRVIQPAAVGTINRMLETVVAQGTGTRAIIPGRPVGGKTGTSQDFRDAWFIGFVNGLTTGVWLGNDDNSPTKKATGGALTSVLWNRYMTVAVEGLPVRPLPAPNSRRRRRRRPTTSPRRSTGWKRRVRRCRPARCRPCRSRRFPSAAPAMRRSVSWSGCSAARTEARRTHGRRWSPRPSAVSQALASSVRGARRRQIAQKRSEWFISLRCATSCAAR